MKSTAVSESSGVSDWQRAHDELSEFARARSGLDWQEGRLLLRALRSGAHVRLGYATFGEYVERLFGYGRRLISEKVRVAEALEELPVLAQALEGGEISWSVARELTRVAIPKTESEWREAARGRTSREVEGLVSGHKPGNLPKDRPDPRMKRHVLRFEVSGETAALFREALGRLRRDSGEPIGDDAALLLMARHVLGGSRDEGRASYQIALNVCEGCRHAEQIGKGEGVAVAPEVVAMAECDAQHIGQVQAVSRVDDGVTSAPNVKRATQTIPPGLRRQVVRRDKGCCVVPGCLNATFIDVHHIDPREEGGQHEIDNLCCLCAAHHRALHRGTLLLEGRPSTRVSFRHADGTPYGGAVSPRRADERARVFGALTGLGFRATEARRALDEVTANVGAVTCAEELLRGALARLTQPTTSVPPWASP